ncbi:hypothetical protein EDD22DRAFT_954869 [Suillus occidentalis]|nr:hypothetical protein EDD22DRAFT_954869 [Suillus occidentalis]
MPFIPSALSALEALLKAPIWLVRKVISIFFGKSPSPPTPPVGSHSSSPSDSPYTETAHSQPQRSHGRTQSQWQQRSTYHPYPPPRPTAEHSESAHSQPQRSHERTQWQQSSTHHQYPPPRPTAEHSESAYSQHQRSHEGIQSQRQRSTDLSYPQPHPAAIRYPPLPSQHTSSQPPSHRQPSVRLPAQPTPPVSPHVSPVVEPLQSRIPQRVPEVAVTPVVIDPHEDIDSLRLKARHEADRMKESFKQSREAFARNERGLAKQLSLRGEAYKDNMMRLNREASTKIFQEHNQRHAGSNTIDLHGLFVPEAKLYFDNAVRGARDRGETSLYVIVGKGNRSENNIAKIKPTIQEYGTSFGLGVEVDPLNDGCLVVSLNDN